MRLRRGRFAARAYHDETLLITRLRRLCAGLALAVLASSVLIADARERNAGVRVSWSDGLDLSQLSDLGARFSRPFGQSVEMSKGGKTATARDCGSLMALRSRGFESTRRFDYELGNAEIIRCVTLNRLKSARPARSNHLGDFTWSADAVNVLPPSLAATFSEEDEAKLRTAEAQGKRLNDVQRDMASQVKDGSLVLTGADWELHIDEWARGDFTGDGIEDMIVSVRCNATQGTFESVKLLLLTRRRTDGRIMTVRRLLK